MRFSTPRSRRNTMLYARAVNVVDITLMPAIAVRSRFRSCWLPLRMIPPPVRNSSGSRKLKNAALGLRQNIRRSRRYWRQLSATGLAPPRASGIGCQLQVDVLERGTGDGELFKALSARERFARQLVQQRRRVVRVALDQLAARAAVDDAI